MAVERTGTKSIPSLEDLRALESVTRNGSLNVAAQELGLSNGAVSRRLSNLTNLAGVQLLTRQGRGVELSAAGKTLAEAGVQALDLILAGLDEIRTHKRQETLFLHCEHALAARWLAPRLSTSPIQGLDLTLCFQLLGSNSIDQSSEVGLWIGRSDIGVEGDWVVTPFMEDHMGVVLSPNLYKELGSSLEKAKNIVCRGDASINWQMNNSSTTGGAGNIIATSQLEVIDTALTGAAVGITSFALVEDHIKAGRLIAPHGFTRTGVNYVLMEAGGKNSCTRVAALLTWLRQQVSNTVDTRENPTMRQSIA